jgi:hypothetical protein
VCPTMQTRSSQGATCHHRRKLYIHTANTLRATRKLRHTARSMRPTMRGIRPKSWPRSLTAHHARATCSTTEQGQMHLRATSPADDGPQRDTGAHDIPHGTASQPCIPAGTVAGMPGRACPWQWRR